MSRGSSKDDCPRFNDFLAAYEGAPSVGRSGLARSFVSRQRECGGFPIVDDDGSVVFVYLAEGSEADVRLIGDFTPRDFHEVYWNRTGAPMSRPVPGGALFFTRWQFEGDAGVDYAFVVDGELVLDALNPRVLESGMVGRALATEWIPREGVPRGRLVQVDEPWATPTRSGQARG
jgi:hypothetical protein